MLFNKSAPSSQLKRLQQLLHFKSCSTGHGFWRNWTPPGLFTPKMTYCQTSQFYFEGFGRTPDYQCKLTGLSWDDSVHIGQPFDTFFRVKLKGYVRVGHRVRAELWSAPTQRSALSSLHEYPAKIRSGMVCYPTNQSCRQAVDRSVNHNRFLHIWTFFSSGFL